MNVDIETLNVGQWKISNSHAAPDVCMFPATRLGEDRERLQGSALSPIRDNFDELAVRLGPCFTAEARPTPVGRVPAARDWLPRAGAS